MNNIDRRRFFLLSGASLAAFTAQKSFSQTGPKTGTPDTTAQTQLPADVTRALARYVVSAKAADLPASVRKEASRTLLNWVGCAIGGARQETVDIAVGTFAPFSGPAQASILGRKERYDIMTTSLINGISSHVLDFDDTHSKIVLHPAGPVASAILALAEYRPVSGSEFLNALVVGAEVECRIGNAVYPAHYDTGWHITGTAGVFGAAAASGKLLGLSEKQMLWALGLAATQPVGLQEMFGSMTKSFHPGRAAQNGLTSALLASRNFTSSEQSLEAKYGWANVVSTKHDYNKITQNLGKTYEIAMNTYKPFACGIVLHPTIDGCIQLRNEHKLTADKIRNVEIKVHPLVMQLTGKKTPQSGLEGKFSVYHAASIALIKGSAGVNDFSDQAVRDATVVGLRERVATIVDPSIHEDQARITITTTDGSRLEKYVEHAVGSAEKPMSDAQLEAKFSGLAEGVLPPEQARRVMDLCWKIENLPQASELARAASST